VGVWVCVCVCVCVYVCMGGEVGWAFTIASHFPLFLDANLKVNPIGSFEDAVSGSREGRTDGRTDTFFSFCVRCMHFVRRIKKNKLGSLSPRTNYTDCAIAACR
jgi:hypothetical protein